MYMAVKYIFVTGGVVSGLGKGITAASLGRLLKERGLRVTIQKFDPYINVDPGTMSPYQHGEVFVTEDGAEADLDLGHYERFIDENLNKNSNVTTGKIYWSIIHKERKGEFLGATVQVIPHVTNAIKERIYRVGKADSTDIVITEIGGTVGDIESLPFLEAIRQVSTDVGREHVMYIHVTLLPYLGLSGEPKTKPTQHSVKELRSIGISPDVIVCRTEKPISEEVKEKLGLFCSLPKENVIQNLDLEVLYEVPLMFEKEGLAKIVCDRLSLVCNPPDLKEWTGMVDMHKNLKEFVRIAMVGKYVELHDAYISVVEALKHAGIYKGYEVNIQWVNAEILNTDNLKESLHGVDGILVPGGFGERGIEGKVLAVSYARENQVPFLGICLGMQVAVIEFARNVAKIKGANSSEFVEGLEDPVIDIMPEQKDVDEKGGTMRLGLYPCKLVDGTLAKSEYGSELIYERHRHRYEFNNNYREILTSKGLVIAGLSPCEKLVEMIEISDHPYFLGVQFHPEFKSRPNKPHPLFTGFVKASIKNKTGK
jgi:CTP synthase